jgi:hypothetical protein
MAATIDDLFKEIERINTNLKQIEGTLNSTLPSLVTNSTYASQALAFMMKQNQAILCNLGQVAKNTCGILNEEVEQTRLQEHIAGAAERVRDLLNSVYSAEAVNLERLEHMRKELEACCPKERSGPPCTDKPCTDPGPGPQPPEGNPIP